MELFISQKTEGRKIFLDEEESHHCVKVMRHKIGEELMVSDGKGKLVRAKFTSELKKQCVLEEIELIREETKPLPAIHLAIAPTKSIDRFEWFLEKATEIGITEITPVICQRSERDKIKPDRLEKIISAAMKQSLRLWLPVLNPVMTLKSFFNSKPVNDYSKYIAHCQSQNLPSLKSLYKAGENVLIMIGPEGDFTLEEISLSQENGFSAVSLGNNRLRTETAGMVAVHTIRLLNS